jgi:hypothetical protein
MESTYETIWEEERETSSSDCSSGSPVAECRPSDVHPPSHPGPKNQAPPSPPAPPPPPATRLLSILLNAQIEDGDISCRHQPPHPTPLRPLALSHACHSTAMELPVDTIARSCLSHRRRPSSTASHSLHMPRIVLDGPRR